MTMRLIYFGNETTDIILTIDSYVLTCTLGRDLKMQSSSWPRSRPGTYIQSICYEKPRGWGGKPGFPGITEGLDNPHNGHLANNFFWIERGLPYQHWRVSLITNLR